jgi:hypothetical protein
MSRDQRFRLSREHVLTAIILDAANDDEGEE